MIMIFEGYYIDHKLDHMVEASVPQEARQMRHHVGHVGGCVTTHASDLCVKKSVRRKKKMLN